MKTFDFKIFRAINNLSQKETAQYFGVSQPFISQMERGTSPVPEQYISKIEQDKLYKLPEIIIFDENEGITQNNKNGDNINGKTINVNDSSEKFLEIVLKQADQLSTSQVQISKSQEQIDRLITIIESRNKI